MSWTTISTSKLIDVRKCAYCVCTFDLIIYWLSLTTCNYEWHIDSVLRLCKIRELFYIEHSKSFYQYLIDITFPCAFKQCVIYKIIEATFRNYYFNKKKITENVFVLWLDRFRKIYFHANILLHTHRKIYLSRNYLYVNSIVSINFISNMEVLIMDDDIDIKVNRC
jgi:hypothetical protein